MTRFYLRLIIPIAAVCLTIMLTARAIGTNQPPNPALRGFVEGCEDKPQPCWYGIVPGVTNGELANSILINFGFIRMSENSFHYDDDTARCSLFFTFIEGTDIIESVQMVFCGEMNFGEIMATYGVPNSVIPYLVQKESAIYFNPVELAIHVKTTSLSAFSDVLFVVLSAKARDYVRDYAVPWTGFKMFKYYCQLQISIAQSQSPHCSA